MIACASAVEIFFQMNVRMGGLVEELQSQRFKNTRVSPFYMVELFIGVGFRRDAFWLILEDVSVSLASPLDGC